MQEYFLNTNQNKLPNPPFTSLQKPNDIFSSVLEFENKNPYKPRTLSAKELPKVLTRVGGEIELEETEFVSEEKNKAFFTANSHGLIFSMLAKATKYRIVGWPITSILNVDFHADAGSYHAESLSYSSSWQRYAVDQGYWTKDQSYNWQPEHSTATLLHDDYGGYFRKIGIQEASGLSVEVLSVDLDFFSNISATDTNYHTYLDIIAKLASGAKLMMLFSSANWNFDYLNQKSKQSLGQVQTIVDTLCRSFLSVPKKYIFLPTIIAKQKQ